MTQDVSPELFLDRLMAFQESAALKAAVRLGVFDALGAAPAGAAAVAAEVGAAEKGVRVLCDFLTMKGFLTKADGVYDLTASTRVFLTKASPACIAGVVEFLAGEDQFTQFMANPDAMVRKGGAVERTALAPEHPMWVSFAKAMTGFMAPVAGAVAAQVALWPTPPARVLDIAAGHGLFGIEVGKLSDKTHVTGLDWAPVLEVAKAHVAQAGLSDRYGVIPGDGFATDWGSGYDLILLPNFLHHFNFETCVGLLVKARAALAPGGRALVVEFMPNEDRVSPLAAARFAYTMLASTEEGDAYTASEFEAMRAASGFGSLTITPLAPTPQTLLTYAD
jgi:2-polyprenyl-3-methyl-5-hydroxy-6-metoxy-1,4-benzoquinol methylase